MHAFRSQGPGAGAMQRLMGPAWDKPTCAGLMVVTKRLDLALAFEEAASEVRTGHDKVCLSLMNRLRDIGRYASA